MSKREEAPYQTDCLTAIAYLIEHSTLKPIPITYIGDMPRELAIRGWSVEKIPKDKLQEGDIVFAGQKNILRRIHHVGLVCDGKIVHSSPKGVFKEDPEDFFRTRVQKFEKEGEPSFLIHYIDKRNFVEKLRERRHV